MAINSPTHDPADDELKQQEALRQIEVAREALSDGDIQHVADMARKGYDHLIPTAEDAITRKLNDAEQFAKLNDWAGTSDAFHAVMKLAEDAKAERELRKSM
jgi:hypothetical protein